MNLTNEEIIALRDFLAHQYVSGENLVMLNLVRRLMHYESIMDAIKEFDNNEQMEAEANDVRSTKDY